MITVANRIKAYAIGNAVYCVNCTKAAYDRGEYVLDGRDVHDHHGVGMWVSDTHGDPVHAVFTILHPTNCDTCRESLTP